MVVVLIVLALVAGAASVVIAVAGRDDAGAASTTSRVTADGWDERIEPLARFVEQERGQRMSRAVSVRFLDDDAFVRALDFGGMDEGWGELQSATDRALGWIGPGIDSEVAWTELGEAGVAAFYDPGRRRIFVRGTPGDGELPVPLRVIVVHELTHAWQDQTASLDGFVEDAEAGLAWQAVVEGDAMHVESAYVATLSPGEQAAWQVYETSARAGRRASTTTPPMLELAALAPYVMGERLVATLDAVNGDRGVDRALADPPPTSEQAMFAAVLSGRVPADDVVPLELPRGARIVDERRIGAWDVFTTLITRVDGRTATLASRGWSGGQEIRWEDDDRVCVGWALQADSEAAAGRLTSALRAWGAAGPAGAATVSTDRLGWTVQMVACDPDVDVVAPRAADVADAAAWLWLHEDIVEALAADVSLPRADCAATRVLTDLDARDVTAADQADHGPDRFIEAARSALASCADITTVVG